MRACGYVLLLALVTCAPTAWGASARREPHIGYLFPAGGKRGATFEVTVGGQSLRGVTDVYVSGEGVSASVVGHYRPPRNLMADQRRELQRQLAELREQRLAELKQQGRDPKIPQWVLNSWRPRTPPGEEAEGTAEAEPVELPGHPLLRNLKSKNLRQLQYVANRLLDWRTRQKRQLNTQLADMVVIEVTIDAGAPPGDRELRLGSPLGLTNPLCFQVGVLPEVCEQEPNDPVGFEYLPQEPPAELPVVLNGQIMPGDVDRFRFRADQGQRLVVEIHARRLVPFLADAVPGWFQATVALYDADGREVAFEDDYRFHPDPVLLYEVPRDGEYVLEVRDAIYRGREDFVYRIAVGELPFITQAFPLGGRAGTGVLATLDGWNLPARQLRLGTAPGSVRVRRAALQWGESASNEVTFAVDTLPECTESEPNDAMQRAQRVELPLVVNGRIAQAGDADVFLFEGRAGDEVVAEVLARRLHSPLDSLLRLTDDSGRMLAWNDDHTLMTDGYLHPDMGLLTHHADSYLSARLPADGAYCVHLSDAQGGGGQEYAYRLRLSPPRPDFALRAAPSSLGMAAGGVLPFAVHVLRTEGFDGDVEIVLKNAPAGFVLDGGRIPGGRDHIRMTLAVPREALPEPLALQLEGRAQIGGKTVTRPVEPAEDVMQAFLYRHLLPSQEFLVAVREVRWPRARVEVAGDLPVRVPVGGTALVRLKRRNSRRLRKVELVPIDPPEGVTVQDATVLSDGLAFQLRVEGEAPKVGFADNLIVEAFGEFEVATEAEDGAEPGTETRRWSIGILPAVPYVVVEP